jgi:hypothetical protein
MDGKSSRTGLPRNGPQPLRTARALPRHPAARTGGAVAQAAAGSWRRGARSLVLLAVVLAGCSVAVQRTGSQPELRPAEDVPVLFTTTDGLAAEDGCRSSMVDPRDQTVLRLIRSARFGMSYHGDYEVPAGRYGVREAELLRLDCATGEVVGIVRS